MPPEHPEVHLRIDEHGAVRRASAQRWGNAATIRELQPSGQSVA